MLGVFYVHSGSLRTRGRTLLAIVVYAAATVTVWVIYDYTQQYLTPTTIVVGALLILGMLGVIAVLFAEAHEWAEAHWTGSHPRLLDPARTGRGVEPQGLDPRAGLQRAAGHADRDARCARAPRLPELRSHRDRQQHAR